MDTSLLNVDLQPSYIRCEIKGKITQIKFPEEIMVEKSKVQRSQTTGWLCVTMPKADARQIEAKKAKYAEIKAFAQGKKKEEELEKKQKEAEDLHKRTVALEELYLKESSLTRKSAAAGDKKTMDDFYIKESEPAVKKDKFIVDFDEDEVPGLE